VPILVYLFWPNPANASYTSPKVVVLLIVCSLLVVLWILLKFWRARVKNLVTRKLTRSWPAASLWFGVVGLFLIVARVEQVSYVSMRVWWFVWLAAFLAYLFIQVRIFRARHYEILPQTRGEDPRGKYLPHRKLKR
jgi:hypothetical protein